MAPERWAELVAQIEALLFLGDPPFDPREPERFGVHASSHQAYHALEYLAARYHHENRPYALVRVEDGYTFGLRPHYRNQRPPMKSKPSRPATLSPTLLTVLAVVVYRQPIAESAISELVGLEAGPYLRSLVRQRLVQLQSDGTVADLYVVDPGLWSKLGLNSAADLPVFDALLIENQAESPREPRTSEPVSSD